MKKFNLSASSCVDEASRRSGYIGSRATKTFLRTLAAFLAVAPSIAFTHGPDQAPHRIAELGEFQLEGGAVISNLRMSYVTHGTLNEARDNAILVMHGFANNHHNADHLIGPGKAFDTDKYFVIVSDSLGSTQTGFDHSTSATSSGLKLDFPRYNGRDMVNAEHRLVTAGLGIDHLVAVAGISMGGYKTLQFAVSHPDFMDAAIPIVGSGLWSSMGFLSDILLRSAIENCAGWEDGDYDENPRNCAAAALTGIIPQFYTRDWWDENAASEEAFKAWHGRWWDTYLGLQDARDLYLMWTAPREVADTPGFKGDLAAALGAIRAKVLFIMNPHDQFVSAELIEQQDAMIRGSRIASIDRNTGHLICCGEDTVATQMMTTEISTFLDSLGR